MATNKQGRQSPTSDRGRTRLPVHSIDMTDVRDNHARMGDPAEEAVVVPPVVFYSATEWDPSRRDQYVSCLSAAISIIGGADAGNWRASDGTNEPGRQAGRRRKHAWVPRPIFSNRSFYSSLFSGWQRRCAYGRKSGVIASSARTCTSLRAHGCRLLYNAKLHCQQNTCTEKGMGVHHEEVLSAMKCSGCRLVGDRAFKLAGRGQQASRCPWTCIVCMLIKAFQPPGTPIGIMAERTRGEKEGIRHR